MVVRGIRVHKIHEPIRKLHCARCTRAKSKTKVQIRRKMLGYAMLPFANARTNVRMLTCFFFHGATQNSTTLWKKLRKSPFVSKERKKKLIKLFNASYEEKKNVLNMSQSRVETLKTSSQIPSEGDFVIRWPLLGYFGLFGILFFVTVW